MSKIAEIERRILRVDSVLILLSIAAIAASDRPLAPTESLGFLYLIPLSYSALTQHQPGSGPGSSRHPGRGRESA